MQFFSSRGFIVHVQKNKEKYAFTVIPRAYHGIIDKLTVNISYTSENLTIEFIAGNFSRSLIRYGNFLSLFGGGTIFLKGLKSQEEQERLERDFWYYVDHVIYCLTR